MPTILRIGPYRFYFYVGDRNEPPHIHVQREDNMVKMWLEPVHQGQNIGFRAVELRQIQRIVEEHQIELLEAWNEYFKS